MTIRHFTAGAICVLASAAAWACGPFFPNSYIVFGGENALNLPEFVFMDELAGILGKGIATEDVPDTFVEVQWANTLKSDTGQLGVALQGTPDKENVIKEYAAMREAMHGLVVARIKTAEQEELHLYESDSEAKKKEKEAADAAKFDLGPHEPLLGKIPTEFSEYVRGACAYYNGDYDGAISHFEAVLNAPADQRKYRSTWAAFMLGKTWLAKDPSQAAAHFQHVRELVAQGLEDALKLASDSLGWQARAEMKSGNFVASIRHYAEFSRQPENKQSAFLSLDTVCQKALTSEEIDPALVNDLMCRQILTAWLVACPSNTEAAKKWLAALDNVDTDGAVAGADRLACIAYNAGDMTAAQRWIAHSAPDAPYAQWVRAKLLLRDGKMEEAAQILQTLSQLPDERFANAYSAARTKGDLAITRLRMNDYPGALDAFLKAGGWEDAAYVAEDLLTVDALEAYLKSHTDDPELQYPVASNAFLYEPEQVPAISMARYLLARRLARLNQWERARDYYPAAFSIDTYDPNGEKKTVNMELPQWAATMAQRLREGNDSTSPARKRAENLFEAAKTIREYGMELLGTELAPDWRLLMGSFELRDNFGTWNGRDSEFKPTANEQALAQSNAPSPNERFHYRYKAADLMKQCAALLPNNDVMTAQALYLGGTYLKNRDPKAADYFYKALVRRNPNLLIAQQADRLRWFPAEFTDEVAYWPLPSRWMRHRMLVGFSAAGAAAIAAAAAASVVWRRRKRRLAATGETH